MAEENEQASKILPLTEEQKDAAIEDLHERGATFFTWRQLKSWIRSFGPKTKIEEIQKALDNQEDQKTEL